MKIACVILNVVKNLLLPVGLSRSFALLRMTLLFWCIPCFGYTQESFRILFWNVENLFHPSDEPKKNDNEFLPESTRHWTYFRYREKLNKIAKTIIASGKDYVPDLVGMCEVENDSCLMDLVKYSPLREAGYRYVMTNSPDQRGIDVALLYQRGTFQLLQQESIRIPSKKIRKAPTRDILHVVGKVLSGDSLDVFVCHMPSRSGGQAKSEPYRLFTASVLRQKVDSVLHARKNPRVVIMGDFNDYPADKSVRKVLCAGKSLRNLMKGKKEGTYRYRGEWGILDQFIVSSTLLKRKGSTSTSAKQAHILRLPFLLEEDDKYGGDKPFRTYNGMKYKGGYSDHLPIVLDLNLFIRDDKDYCLE